MPSLCILSIIPGYANLSFFSVSNTATKEKAIPTIQSNHPPCYFPSPDPHVLLVYLLLTLMYSHRPSCVLDPSIGCLHWFFPLPQALFPQISAYLHGSFPYLLQKWGLTLPLHLVWENASFMHSKCPLSVLFFFFSVHNIGQFLPWLLCSLVCLSFLECNLHVIRDFVCVVLWCILHVYNSSDTY